MIVVYDKRDEVDGLSVDYSVLSTEQQKSIDNDSLDIDRIDRLILQNNEVVASLNSDIEKYTCNADWIDCALAASSGVLTGLMDAFFDEEFFERLGIKFSGFSGKWDFKRAKDLANQDTNRMIMEFANKVAKKDKSRKTAGDFKRLDQAISYLEEKFPFPGDNNWKVAKVSSTIDHHLDDIAHHHSVIGLITSICRQFTGVAVYSDSHGITTKVMGVAVNDYGDLVGEGMFQRFFCGIVNWFKNVAGAAENWKGHQFSDMGGSKGSAVKGNSGMGVAGPITSTLKELAAITSNEKLSSALHRAYANGIGDKKSQLNLGIFNPLFDGASSKLDSRTELAIKNLVKKQSRAVIFNNAMAVACRSIRNIIQEYHDKGSLNALCLSSIIPSMDRTLMRMITIANGAFEAVDVIDALARPEPMILRLNFVGIGSFAVSLGADCGMGVRKWQIKRRIMVLNSERMHLYDAKTLYSVENLYRLAQKTGEKIAEAAKRQIDIEREFRVLDSRDDENMDEIRKRLSRN